MNQVFHHLLSRNLRMRCQIDMLLKICSLPSLATIEPSILPDVVAGWEQMTYYERKRTDNSNEQFFCRLHFLVGLAEAAEEILKSTIEEEEIPLGLRAPEHTESCQNCL